MGLVSHKDLTATNFHDLGEGHITILPWNYSAITQGTWVFWATSGQWAGYTFENSTQAQNDQIDYQVYLVAGTYTFVLLAYHQTNSAILTLLIDAASVGTIDTYGAGLANQRSTITSISVTTAGLKTVSFKAATKNASSSSYYLWLSAAALFRTA